MELARDSRFGRSPPRGGSGGGGFRRGIPPGRKTEYRLVVENLASRTSWQVKRAQVPPGPRTREEEGGFIPLTWSWEENRSQQKSHCIIGLLSSSTTHGNECQFPVLYSRFIVDTHIGKLTGSPNPPPPLRGVWYQGAKKREKRKIVARGRKKIVLRRRSAFSWPPPPVPVAFQLLWV